MSTRIRRSWFKSNLRGKINQLVGSDPNKVCLCCAWMPFTDETSLVFSTDSSSSSVRLEETKHPGFLDCEQTQSLSTNPRWLQVVSRSWSPQSMPAPIRASHARADTLRWKLNWCVPRRRATSPLRLPSASSAARTAGLHGSARKASGSAFFFFLSFFLLLERKCWRTLQSTACVAAQLPCLPPTARGRQSAERSKPKPPRSASLSLKQPLRLCWLHSDQQQPTFDEDAEYNWQSRRLSPANPSLHRFYPAPPTRRPKSTNDARSSQCARRLGRSEPLRASDRWTTEFTGPRETLNTWWGGADRTLCGIMCWLYFPAEPKFKPFYLHRVSKSCPMCWNGSYIWF